MDHLISTVDALKVTHGNSRVILMGDLNDFDREALCRDLHLRNLVTRPTHRGSLLDCLLTDAEWYSTDATTHEPPIGLSEHDCIVNRPAPPTPPTFTTITRRPWVDSGVREFGQWVTAEEWVNVLRADDVDQAVAAFEDPVRRQYEHCFPQKRVRARPRTKPWVTAPVLRLMGQRRREWHRCRRSPAWRRLYRRVRYELRHARHNTARDVEQHPTNSSKFARGIKSVLSINKKHQKLNIFDQASNPEIAERIRDHFTTICTKHPPLDPNKLPAYLPAKDDILVVERETVYQ